MQWGSLCTVVSVTHVSLQSSPECFHYLLNHLLFTIITQLESIVMRKPLEKVMRLNWSHDIPCFAEIRSICNQGYVDHFVYSSRGISYQTELQAWVFNSTLCRQEWDESYCERVKNSQGYKNRAARLWGAQGFLLLLLERVKDTRRL